MTTRRLSIILQLLLALTASALVTGCASVGAGRIESGRNQYNVAIQRTSAEQLLLNLIRLKYRDAPFFLEVNSVATQFTLGGTAVASASLPESAANSFGLTSTLTLQERPTITYSPLQGDEFVHRVLKPVSLDTIVLLVNSGWSIDRVLRICGQRLNGLKNAPGASGPTPQRAPEFHDYVRTSKLLRKLQSHDRLHLGYALRDGHQHPVLRISNNGSDKTDYAGLTTLLNVDGKQQHYWLTTGLARPDSQSIAIDTRSLLGIMFYLSQAVDVPRADRDKGLVTRTRDHQGKVFDWNAVTGEILKIHSADQRPAGAAIAIRYRSHWFYVADNDLNSKSTFTLLQQLFALQAGKSQGSAPLLTLPLGG